MGLRGWNRDDVVERLLGGRLRPASSDRPGLRGGGGGAERRVKGGWQNIALAAVSPQPPITLFVSPLCSGRFPEPVFVVK